jgi:hypothetical protein
VAALTSDYHRFHIASRRASVRARDFSLRKRRQRFDDGLHQHHRSRPLARSHRSSRPHLRLWAIKTNIADSLNVVVQVERRPGRRYISEVHLINSYDPDVDLFDYGTVFQAKGERE